METESLISLASETLTIRMVAELIIAIKNGTTVIARITIFN